MRAVLDACVLYPTVLREILTGAAAAGLFQPFWSQRILDEWRHAAARNGLEVGAEIALLVTGFPRALAAPAAVVLGADLPDPADHHVAETALAAGARLIVTANLRDFPRGVLGQLGLRTVHPDEFLRDLYLQRPDAILAAVTVTEARARAAGGALARRDLLRRARLPRLASAMARG
ncbi:PIN domain-containing protein [Paracoccus sp. (in: a-proteobacteria)]|uniref:RSP_2648 family PIN domain-containing protein n=1 Tax=Paracoccus sp. TaxID=267 RepID=UPI00321F7CF2